MNTSDTLRLAQAMAALRRVHIRTLRLSSLDHREFHLLKSIVSEQNGSKGLTIGDLSKMYDISKPAISNLIRKTEQKGFVERQTDKADRRVVWVKITPAGLEELEKTKHRWEELGEKIETKFGEENLETFLKLTDRLTAAVNEVINEERTEGNNNQ